MSSEKQEVPISLAATVVVLRETAKGPEVLLVQRASELAFHGGAWVFPGGRVEEADYGETMPAELVLDPEATLAVARRAAVRETFEEAGLTIAPERLVPVSHWTTPEGRPRRFATWFFAVLLDQPREVVIDGGEIRAHQWLTASEALGCHAKGELELPPPTFVTLSALAPFESSTHWFLELEQRAPPIYVPRPRLTLEGVVSLYHGDVAYHGGKLTAEGPRHRLNMFASRWSYQVPAR